MNETESKTKEKEKIHKHGKKVLHEKTDIDRTKNAPSDSTALLTLDTLQ
jgi:hypothetical protein